MHIELRDLRVGDRDKLAEIDGGNGWNADPILWASYLADQENGVRLVVIAWNNERPVGYGTLVWEAIYEPFRTARIPEINNLGVVASVRRQGVASAIIHHLEERARCAGRASIGLGVGLYADYGPAQRLYFGLGYRPDGRGITHRNRPLAPLEMVSLDDDLVLWLSKPLF
jgi:GNAT superfamily N-acetyltransferase